jgi:hypothetical protein
MMILDFGLLIGDWLGNLSVKIKWNADFPDKHRFVRTVLNQANVVLQPLRVQVDLRPILLAKSSI